MNQRNPDALVLILSQWASIKSQTRNDDIRKLAHESFGRWLRKYDRNSDE